MYSATFVFPRLQTTAHFAPTQGFYGAKSYLALAVLGWGLASCSDTGVTPAGGSGSTGHSESTPCFQTEGAATSILLGPETEPSSFEPYQEGQTVELIYGSQAGMGLGAMVQVTNLDLAEADEIEVVLVVDESPIGRFSQEAPHLECMEGASHLDTMVMIDVTDHPTVTSVAQLDGRSALLDYRAISDGSALAEGRVSVELSL